MFPQALVNWKMGHANDFNEHFCTTMGFFNAIFSPTSLMMVGYSNSPAYVVRRPSVNNSCYRYFLENTGRIILKFPM